MLEKLNNTAKILLQKPTRDGGFVVLARTPGYQPLVTWWADSKGACFNGHYFMDDEEGVEAALEDYNKRN